MGIIRTITPDIVAKIAAGEVIERPAYAVKELVENAIDAGATRIQLELTDAGLARIALHDNGIGMSKEDMEVSFLPHTTSKLTTSEDLSQVSSLGFRGEALYSIAAVSRLTIRSRQGSATQNRSQSGHEIVVEAGNLQSSKKIGMPKGTSIIVEDLFYTTPVRKKFLKSTQTELRIILEIVTNAAFSHPEISFQVKHNGKVLLDVPKDQELEQRLEYLLGSSIQANLLPISIQEGEIGVEGFIGKPVSDRLIQKQFYFINRRPVQYQLLSTRIKHVYGSLLEPRAQPFVFLFFTLPYQYVDVNIHPRKEQVHVLNEQKLAELVGKTISATLQQNNLTYKPFYGGEDMLHDGGTHTYAGKTLKKEVDIWGKEFTQWKKTDDVLQIHNLYLAVPTKKGMMMVDQHAAHERILYEQFLEEFQKKSAAKGSLQLNKPVLFDLSVADTEALKEFIPELKETGFEIEEFGEHTFKVSSVPELLQDRNIPELIKEALHDAKQGLGVDNVDVRTHRMLSYLACRSAIKSGDKLNKEQARELIQKLNECKTEYTCPHGRPVKVEISLHELERIFHRR